MSKENARLFLAKVQADAGLQATLKAVFLNNRGQAQDDIIQLAAEHGFHFAAADLEQLAAEAAATGQRIGELQDAELETIAGGSTEAWILLSLATAGVGCAVSAATSCL